MKIDVIKSIAIVVFFAVFIVCGCKGQEEKQRVSGLPSSESGKTVGHQEPEVSATEPSSLSQEVKSDIPPKITSVKIHPEIPAVGDKIKAEVATSATDADNLMLTFHWSRNGAPLSESSDTLLLSGDFKRGDRISLTVVPDDGKRKGNPSTIAMTVGNRPPVITDPAGSFKVSGRQYAYQINAIDPEDDSLTYSLKSAPPGMTVDSSTGLIKWNIPADFKGNVSFAVSVSDGHGGEASQNFNIEIKPEATEISK